MRVRIPVSQTSPLPHDPSAPPLLRSPSSALGLTASQRRRGQKMSRASSDEPTFAGGLANWRREPKVKAKGSGTASGSEGKKGSSGKGLGMGMASTPAKKGKRSDSKVSSQPA